MEKKKILVIDDEVNIAETLADILSIGGYDVKTAFDGERGFSMAVKEDPDLILCDVMMPRMNGYEVLEAIRSNRHTQQVPFIFLTAKGNNDHFRQGMDLGADDYLVKPIDSNDLFRVIENRLIRQQTLLEAGHLAENERLSKDLHDTLQQTLLALQMKLNRLRERTVDEAQRHDLNESLDFVKLAFSQLRMILENTELALQQAGFAEGLEDMIRRVSQYVEFTISVHNELRQEIPRPQAVVLFRVILEALNNVIKHARASKVTIHVTGSQAGISLTVTDDGRGFDLNTVKMGHGLRNIKERIAEIGGNVTIDSAEGGGTTVKAVLVSEQP